MTLKDAAGFLKPNGNPSQQDFGICIDCRRIERAKHPKSSKRIRELVFQLAEGLCSYCDVPLEPRWHVDHVTPRNLGGEHVLENLLAACPTCNAGHLSFIQHQLRQLHHSGVPKSMGAAWYVEIKALHELGIVNASTFWERRQFVQHMLRVVRRYRHPGLPRKQHSLDRLSKRIAHLSEAAQGVHRNATA